METNPTATQNTTQPNPESPHAPKTSISKRTIALIVALAAFAVFFLFLALRPQYVNKNQIAQIPTPTPTPFAHSVLTIEPDSNVPQGAKKTYNVMIDSNINIVNAVQLTLGYDPQALSNVTIEPGTFFDKPVQLMKDIDTKNGRISYALGIQPADTGKQGKGIVAVITFSILPTATGSSTTISFLPKTLVAGQGVNQSVLKSSQNVTIPLGSTSPSSGVTTTP